MKILPSDHLAIQDAFQKHVDNAVSKTINLPHDAGVETVLNIYLKAYRMGLKGSLFLETEAGISRYFLWSPSGLLIEAHLFKICLEKTDKK